MRKDLRLKVERLKIVEMDSALKEEIDLFIERNLGTIFHETAFNAISAKTLGTELSYYIARNDGKLAGICPCHSVKDRALVSTFSNWTSKDLVYGGWVYDPSSASLEDLHVKTKARWNEALHFSTNIELDPKAPRKPSSVNKYKQAHTLLLRLEGSSEDEVFQGFRHAQKNKIRKAAKLGVRIEQIRPENMVSFYELLTELKENVNKEYSPQAYYREVFSHYFGKRRAACFIAAFDGENVSTLIVLANRAFTTIWMGGRKMGIPNNLYQNELMIWEAIKWAISFGSEYFDFCTVDETKHANLARMKLSFSRDFKPYYYYTVKGLSYRFLSRMRGNAHE